MRQNQFFGGSFGDGVRLATLKAGSQALGGSHSLELPSNRSSSFKPILQNGQINSQRESRAPGKQIENLRKNGEKPPKTQQKSIKNPENQSETPKVDSQTFPIPILTLV